MAKICLKSLREAGNWFNGLDLNELQQITGLRPADFDESFEFVNHCIKWWESQSPENRMSLYNEDMGYIGDDDEFAEIGRIVMEEADAWFNGLESYEWELFTDIVESEYPDFDEYEDLVFKWWKSQPLKNRYEMSCSTVKPDGL